MDLTLIYSQKMVIVYIECSMPKWQRLTSPLSPPSPTVCDLLHADTAIAVL